MSYHNGNQLIDPYLLFQKTQLQEGMHVADFGCGRTGHIIFPAALVTGKDGMVFAVDVQKDVLENIQKRANTESMHHLHTIWSNLEAVGKTAIPAGTLDIVFIVNTMCQADNRHAILLEAKRLLKPKGRILLVDWSKKGLTFSPADERFVDFEEIISWARSNGFAVQEKFQVGQYHSGIVLFCHQ